ncbi:MAG: tRNA (adenosine(37)-N6)-threonylcarbamoyltransferase complex dimerization subunit type 1 TsaB [Beijerinckiaceae bacterium]
MSDSARVPSRILAIDTALGACSVCVFDGAEQLPLAFEAEEMATGHAEALMPMIERVMGRVDGGFASLSRVAVSIGPGSFTGLRIGISAARAIGLAAGIPVVGVSTLAGYAAPLINASESGVIAVAIDARHGAVFFQAFTMTGRTIVLPRVLPVKEAGRAIGAGPVKLAGSGAGALAVEAMTLGLKATLADLRPAPDITAIARLGLIADPETAPAKPLYLRPPSAQPQQAKAVARAS